MFEQVAQHIAASVRAMVPGVFETRPASPATHPYVAWRRYAAATAPFTALGFRHLADVEVTSLHVDPRMSRPPALRILVSADGDMVVGIYRLALRWSLTGVLARLSGGAATMTDVMTHFADGTIVETSTAEPANVWTTPPFLYRAYLAASVPLEARLAHHHGRVERHAAAAPGRTVVRHTTVESMLEVAAESERRKREHRRSIGWVTDDELRRLSRLDGERLAQLTAAVRAALSATEPPPTVPGQQAA